MSILKGNFTKEDLLKRSSSILGSGGCESLTFFPDENAPCGESEDSNDRL
jgi:hypothetical protein